MIQYPVKITFKLLTLATRISVVDAAGTPIFFIRQKMFRLREHIQVFRDSSENELLFEIRAKNVIDFSASYSFTAVDGSDWGSVRRKGIKSLWRAHYQIMNDNQIDMTLSEENPWKKVLETVLGEIPLIGLVAIYLLNPSYTIASPSGERILRITKN